MRKVSVGVVWLILLGILAACGTELPPPEDVFCVVSVDGGVFERVDTVFLKTTEALEIRPVFVVDDEYYSEVDTFLDHGKEVSARQARFPVFWSRAKPTYKKGGYDNVENAPKDRFAVYKDDIPYAVEPLPIGASLIVLGDVAPSNASGTYYIKALTSPAERSEFRTTSAIHKENDFLQVVVRPDDSYLGYARELWGTPFIMCPKKMENGLHQTDERVGSDCAELAIYARRRMGFPVPYCGPKGLYPYLEPVVSGLFTRKKDSAEVLMVSGKGETVAVGDGGLNPGDLLHYGTQVAVFYEDVGVIGLLDGADIVLQSYGETPHFSTLLENEKIFGGFQIFRWK